MSCEGCAAQFGVFRRRRACAECGRAYCGGCLRRAACAPCRVLAVRPLCARAAAGLRARDLQCYLQRRGVSTRGCVEKDELVALCVRVSVGGAGAGERRRGAGGAGGAGPAGGPFSALKGLTNNINDFFAQTFDLRRPAAADDDRAPPAPPAPPAAPAAPARPGPRPPRAAPHPETHAEDPRGAGLSHARVHIAESAPRPPPPAARASPPASSPPARDTLDCLEVEDLADSGWEVLCVPADPLPEDSEVLMAQAERESSTGPAAGPPPPPRPSPPPSPRVASPPRASSELDLRAPPAAAAADSVSLHDEPIGDPEPVAVAGAGAGAGAGPGAGAGADAGAGAGQDAQAAALAALAEGALAALSARGLKVLLARHAVDSRGCLERGELLEHCRRLRRDVAAAPPPDHLPLEDCCKVCMEAPLEVVLLECGHMATCARCAARLAECPICRRYVARAVRVFRS